VQDHVRPDLAQPAYQVFQIVVVDEFEDGIGVEGVVVLLILGAGNDTVDAGADHLQERVFGQTGIAEVIEGLREGPGPSDALIELANGQQPGVAGELTR
jgi:hypothetical protein